MLSQVHLAFPTGVDRNPPADTPSICPPPPLCTGVHPAGRAGAVLPLCGPADTPARPGCWPRCVWGRGGSGPPGRPPPPTASSRSPFEAARPRRRQRQQVHLYRGVLRVGGRAHWAARPVGWLLWSRAMNRSGRDPGTLIRAAAECECTPPSSPHCQVSGTTSCRGLHNKRLRALNDCDFR